MTLALVTGANGHLGANLVRELLGRGQRVRGLVREGADLRGLAGLDVELVRGDVLDVDSVDRAVAGCEVVYHCAAVYKTWARTRDEIVRPAVDGTRHVLAAARRHAVRRVVLTSSAAAVGANRSPDLAPRDETHWNDDYGDAYYEAKTESERLAHALARELGVDLVAVNPTMIVGPHDWRTTPSNGLVRDLLTGRVPITPGGLCWVGVADVARAHVLAAEEGRGGERYLACGVNRTNEQLAADLRALTGYGATLKLPGWAVLAAAEVSEAVAQLTGGRPLVAREITREVVHRYAWHTHDKATRELGWTPAPIDVALAETVRWLVFREELPERMCEELRPRFGAGAAWGGSG
jgi:dihydroflavonol-4-reductase